MNRNFRYILEFNLAMLFMSTSGALGRSIDLAPPVIIFIRCLLAGIFLFMFIRWRGISYRILHRRHFRVIFISSVFLGVHWVTYFYALHKSNVAIAMLSLFTYPVMTTLLEPLMLKTRFLWSNLLLAIIVLVGIFFMAPAFTLENDITLGLVIGLFSAFLYSIRNLLLKKNIVQYSGVTLMFYQLAINAVLLVPVVFIFDVEKVLPQLPSLATLALLTTAIGHTLFVMSFKKFSITAVSIMSSLQPLMGIGIAYLFLGETPAYKTMIGGGLILVTVVIESVRTVRG